MRCEHMHKHCNLRDGVSAQGMQAAGAWVHAACSHGYAAKSPGAFCDRRSRAAGVLGHGSGVRQPCANLSANRIEASVHASIHLSKASLHLSEVHLGCVARVVLRSGARGHAAGMQG